MNRREFAALAASMAAGAMRPQIFDTFGGYAWLYIGSFALGLARRCLSRPDP